MNGKNALVTCHLVVIRVRYSVSQFTLGIPRENLSYLHTKHHPSWLHVSFFNHAFQPALSNLTTLRHSHVPDTKNPRICVIQRRPSVRSESALFLFQAEGVIMAERLERLICSLEAPSSIPALTSSLPSLFSGGSE